MSIHDRPGGRPLLSPLSDVDDHLSSPCRPDTGAGRQSSPPPRRAAVAGPGRDNVFRPTSRACGRWPSWPCCSSTPGSAGSTAASSASTCSSSCPASSSPGCCCASWRRLAPISIQAFWARRARRLLPASCLVLVVTVIAADWMLPPLAQRALGRRRRRRRPRSSSTSCSPTSSATTSAPSPPRPRRRRAALLVAGRRGAVLPGVAGAAGRRHPPTPPVPAPPARARHRHRRVSFALSAWRTDAHRRGPSTCCRRGWASCWPGPRSPPSDRRSGWSRPGSASPPVGSA